MSIPKITARNVSVSYGAKQAIDDISIDVDMDHVIAFIGPSGCGKSTFLRTLNRMNDTIPSARVSGDGHCLLAVEDDGCGMAADQKPQGTGLGAKLIRAMAQSLQTVVEYDPAHTGVRAVMRVPV